MHSNPSALTLAFASGIGVFFSFDRPLPAIVVPVLLILSLASMRCARLRLPAVGLIGLAYAQLASCPMLSHPFADSLLHQNLLIEGRIAELPDISANGTTFLFAVDRAKNQDRSVELPQRIKLGWYQDAPPLNAGEQWQLLVRLKPPHGFVNPGGFDYERWLFQQGIGATGYVRKSNLNQLLDARPGPYLLNRLRQELREHILRVLGDNRPAALVRALVLGDRDGLTPQDWRVLTRTGTNHLIAISGLHIGLIAGAAFVLGRWLWARAGALSLVLAAPRAAALLALAAAMTYSALAGFAVSTQRALIMLAVAMVALLAGRTLRPFAALGIALGAVLLADPLAILSQGFWLSFAAVAALLFALGGRLEQPSLLLRWSRAQWAVAVGLLPLLLLLFDRASLIAPAVNLLAIPLFSLLLPVILLATLTSLSTDWNLPLTLVGQGLDQAFALLAVLADTHWTSVSLGQRPLWTWIAAGIGTLLILAPRGLPGRWLGFVYLLPLIFQTPAPPQPGTAAVTVLDVGQGLAVTVRTARHTLVYDLGPRYRSGFNTGSAVVAPYLQSLGLTLVDRLIVSHADNDHAGGLAGFLDEIEVRQLLSGESEALSTLAADHCPTACRAGDAWNWDGVRFAILHPNDEQLQGNASSCVLRIATDGGSLLLTGDIGTRIESELLERNPAVPHTDILVAGHHGSATSSSEPFLKQLQPSWVIYSAGFANRYGFPAKEVSTRVDRLGIRSLNTASTGGIEFLLPAQGPIPAPRLTRNRQDRRWRHHPPP